MAGPRRTGALAGALELAASTLLERDRQRRARDARALELSMRFSQAYALQQQQRQWQLQDAQAKREEARALQELRGRQGLEQSVLRGQLQAAHATSHTPLATDPAMLAIRAATALPHVETTMQDLQQRDAEFRAKAAEKYAEAFPPPAFGLFGGYQSGTPGPIASLLGRRARPPMPQVPAPQTGPLEAARRRLQQIVVGEPIDATSGFGGALPQGAEFDRPHPELPAIDDPSLQGPHGETEGAQFQTSDGQVFEVQDGQWIRVP